MCTAVANICLQIYFVKGLSQIHVTSPSAFNWWEENCCIFLKKISSPNAFYLFLPLFKYQTTPYNVLFFKKMKNMPFLFLFKQEQEVSGRGLTTTTTKPHVPCIMYIYAINFINIHLNVFFSKKSPL